MDVREDQGELQGASAEDTNRTALRRRKTRQVYLLTYSQADEQKFSTPASFAKTVVNGFANTTGEIQHWVCSMENHRNGGFHFHMAIKLDRQVQWIHVKNALEEHNIIVHFSSAHYNYYTAWRYVVKEDRDFLQSEDHPNLNNTKAPRTNAASAIVVVRERLQNTAEQQPVQRPNAKKKRLSAFEVSQIIIENNIKTRTELLALAQEQKEEGKFDLAEFIVNRGARVVAQVLDTAWELETANETLSRQQKT